MDQLRRRYAIQLSALLIPCAVIGLLGYQWLRLQSESEALRSQDAAEAEVARIRDDLSEHLSEAAEEAARDWQGLPTARGPWAPPPQMPEIIASAYMFAEDGNLLYPNYQGTYEDTVREYRTASENPQWRQTEATIRTLETQGNTTGAQQVLQKALTSVKNPGLRARALLDLGRLAPADRQYAVAESHALQILECCAAARDEYGVSFALYAAAQLTSTFEAQGQLRTRFNVIASRLSELIEEGIIGHPKDVEDVRALIREVPDNPSALSLLESAEQSAARIQREIDTGRRIELWLTGLQSRAPASLSSSLSTFWADGRPYLAGVYKVGDPALLAVLFDTERLSTWIARWSAGGGNFGTALVREGENQANVVLTAPLFTEAPGLDLVLWTQTTDPVSRQSQMLFASALAAALVAIVLLGYFAVRDLSREQKLASMRSSFIAGVTHELKTPLTSIRLFAETLRLKRTRDPDEADQILASLTDESERLAQLVDNVLSFAKIEKGAMAYQPAEIDLSESVGATVRRFQPVLKQGGFRLVHEESNEEPLRVEADAEGLSLALLNLLGNAVKYSGRSREIRLDVRRCGDEAEVRVTDHGIGIPVSEQQRIFDRFYRAPAAEKETTGAGLGLALVQHFARTHKGRVTVESQPAKGSAFSLWLPLIKDYV